MESPKEIEKTSEVKSVANNVASTNMSNSSMLNNNMQTNSIQDNYMPEVLRNPIYTPAFLREQIGKLMRVEFLIGTNTMTDRIGILEDVGASYIILRSFENDSLIYCDLYSIKFITISTTRSNYLPLVNNNNYSQQGNMYWQY